MGGLLGKKPKPDPALVASQKRANNAAAEQAQAAQADKANESVRLQRQGRKQLLFAKTGALGVNSVSPLGGGGT